MTRLRTYALAGAVTALPFLAFASLNSPTLAADFGGDCCADLEERIAELEATTARKGNRKVSLTLTGHVHQMVMFWDDGHESNTYVVGNANDQTNFQFTGDAKISGDLSTGYQITIRVDDTLSGNVDQNNDDDSGFTLWESYWFLKSERAGQISVGLAPRGTDGAPEVDLSEAGAAAYSGVQDIGGGFALRTANGQFAPVAWGDLYSHFNGDTANVVRYDTPEIAGFTLAASWGEDDIWDVALFYAGEFGAIQVEAAVGYTQSTDENGVDGGGDDNFNIVMGSASILHKPSGLNATIAAGQKDIDDDPARTDAKYIYGKLGWQANLSPLGVTAFYGEYGRFEDFVGGVDVSDAVDTILITGNEAEVWGLGVVQHIDAAAMQIYLGYRHHDADLDLLVNGTAVNPDIEEFQTFIAGGIISF